MRCGLSVQAMRSRRDTDPGHAAKSVRFGDASADQSRRTSESGEAPLATQPSFSSAGSGEFENAQVTSQTCLEYPAAFILVWLAGSPKIRPALTGFKNCFK